MNFKEKLDEMRCELGVFRQENCREKDNKIYRDYLREGRPLPADVRRVDDYEKIDDAEFAVITKNDLSRDELMEFVQLKQLKELTTIKKCVMFFTVLTIVSMVLGVLGVMNLL